MDGDDLVQEVPLPLAGKCGIKPNGNWLSKLRRRHEEKLKSNSNKLKRHEDKFKQYIDVWKRELPMIHPGLGLDLDKISPGARHWATQSWVDSQVTSFCVQRSSIASHPYPCYPSKKPTNIYKHTAKQEITYNTQ